MTDVWTHGRWTVKPGNEDEFVRMLGELSSVAQKELGVSPPTLLRDRDYPNVFLTFTPWETIGDIEDFRAFLFPRLDVIRPLLEGFEPQTLDEVALGD
jgi:quinol monooxygenase YgiN